MKEIIQGERDEKRGGRERRKRVEREQAGGRHRELHAICYS